MNIEEMEKNGTIDYYLDLKKYIAELFKLLLEQFYLFCHIENQKF